MLKDLLHVPKLQLWKGFTLRHGDPLAPDNSLGGDRGDGFLVMGMS